MSAIAPNRMHSGERSRVSAAPNAARYPTSLLMELPTFPSVLLGDGHLRHRTLLIPPLQPPQRRAQGKFAGRQSAA